MHEKLYELDEMLKSNECINSIYKINVLSGCIEIYVQGLHSHFYDEVSDIFYKKYVKIYESNKSEK